MTRRRVVVAVLLLGLATGCTTNPSAPSSTDKPVPPPAQNCARTAEPTACVEWNPTDPATGDALFAAWQADQLVSAQMVCTALSDDKWAAYLGPGNYRVIQDGPSCAVTSDDDQVSVKIGLYGLSPLKEYLDRFLPDPTLARGTEQLTIAGVPAMRYTGKTDADGIGTDQEDLTIAPAGDATKPGVLQVELILSPPRGKSASSPVDRSRLGFRDQLITDLLTALFPKR